MQIYKCDRCGKEIAPGQVRGIIAGSRLNNGAVTGDIFHGKDFCPECLEDIKVYVEDRVGPREELERYINEIEQKDENPLHKLLDLCIWATEENRHFSFELHPYKPYPYNFITVHWVDRAGIDYEHGKYESMEVNLDRDDTDDKLYALIDEIRDLIEKWKVE